MSSHFATGHKIFAVFLSMRAATRLAFARKFVSLHFVSVELLKICFPAFCVSGTLKKFVSLHLCQWNS